VWYLNVSHLGGGGRGCVILRNMPKPAAMLTHSLLSSEECLRSKAASTNFNIERKLSSLIAHSANCYWVLVSLPAV